jgi:Ergosterol biosynthesis ERG4/ERG24 family
MARSAAVYCLKFFLWETGYWKTMDIAHDRAGYYLCWGCLNWVPAIYTSQALYLVRHPRDLPAPYVIGILLTGLVMIYINWEADDQRQRVRESEGECTVWGRKPVCITATYTSGAQRLVSLFVRDATASPDSTLHIRDHLQARASRRRRCCSRAAGGASRATCTMCPRSSRPSAGRCRRAFSTRYPGSTWSS